MKVRAPAVVLGGSVSALQLSSTRDAVGDIGAVSHVVPPTPLGL